MEGFALADEPNRAARGIVDVAASSMRRTIAIAVPAALLALVLSLPMSASASVQPNDRATGYAEAVKACPQPQPGFDRCFALVRKPVAGPTADTEKPGVSPFVVGAGATSAGPAGGLTPEDLASAYGYAPATGGSGETVGIVDAFDDPSIASDLAVFDNEYGLPSCTTSNGCLTKVGQSGGATPAPDTSGWSVEIALDVETVHATCPNCHILLVESDNNSEANLATAANEAVALGASVVSNSYGGPERFAGAFERSAYDHPGIPIVASTGDSGYYNWREFEEELQMPNAPASSPSVISVGGTTLTLNPDGTRANETVWPGSGGGCSRLFEARPWQLGVAGYAATGCGDKRLSADVSADADPNTGLDIYDTYNCGSMCEGVDEGWETIGGTSLSAPFIASMYALAGGGHGAPYPSVTLYGHAARFDVTEGGNGACEGEALGCAGIDSIGLGRIDCEGTTECDAAPGYDGPSGVGTPVGLGLFQPELPTATISAPASPVAGSAASFSASGSASFYPGDSIASASWSWGDGTSGGGIARTHTYAAPGTYTVKLTVTDAYGLSSAEAAREVTVAPAVVVVEGGGGGGAGGGSGSGSGVGASGGGGATTTTTSTASTTTSGGSQQGVSGFQSASSTAASARLASSSLKVSSGKVELTIVCAASGASCAGTVTLSAPATGHASTAKVSTPTLGKASFTVASGKTQTVTLRLSAQALALLTRSRGLRATATIALRAGSGAAQTLRSTVTLRPAPSKRRPR
jgi:hypothetical protein